MERERERILQTQKRIAGAQTKNLQCANYAEQVRPSSYNIETPDLDEFPIALTTILNAVTLAISCSEETTVSHSSH